MGTCKPCCSQLSAGPACQLQHCCLALPCLGEVGAWLPLALLLQTQATTFHTPCPSCQADASKRHSWPVSSVLLPVHCSRPAMPSYKPNPSLHPVVTAWWLQAAQQLVALAARLCLESHMCFSDCKINGRPAAWASSAQQMYAATMRSNVPLDQPCRNIVSFRFVQPATAIAPASAEQ